MPGLFSPVEARAEIPVVPEAVWDTISDPTTYPEWLVGAQRMRGVDADFPAPGSELHHSVGPTKGLTVDDSTEATGSAAPHLLQLRVRVGPFRADVELIVLPSPKGSEVRFRERPKGISAALLPLLRPVLHLRNVESLRRLRAHLEAADDRAAPRPS